MLPIAVGFSRSLPRITNEERIKMKRLLQVVALAMFCATIVWSKGTSASTKPCCVFKPTKVAKPKAEKIPKPPKTPKLPKLPKVAKPAKVVVPKLPAALKPTKVKAVKIPKLPKPLKLPKNTTIVIPEGV